MTGTITLSLYKGSVTIVGRSSPFALYDERFVTFGADDVYQQADAAGFIPPLRALAAGRRTQGTRARAGDVGGCATHSPSNGEETTASHAADAVPRGSRMTPPDGPPRSRRLPVGGRRSVTGARARAHRLWGGRFGGESAAALEALNRSVGTDFRLWPFDIRLSKAWTVALWDANVLTLEESQRLEAGLDAVGQQIAGGRGARAERRRHPHHDRPDAVGGDRRAGRAPPHGTQPQRSGGDGDPPLVSRRRRRARCWRACAAAGARRPGGCAPGRPDAGLHAHAARPAGIGRALGARPLLAAGARSRATGGCRAIGHGVAAARVGRGGRVGLPDLACVCSRRASASRDCRPTASTR